MKTVQLINPSKELVEMMQNPTRKWVRTCFSDTCTCFSHDSGYDLYTGELPDEVQFMETGGSVHSHPSTVRVDGEVGRARLDVIAAGHKEKYASQFSTGSRAGERCYWEAREELDRCKKTLHYTKCGMTYKDADALTKKEQEEERRRERRQKKLDAISKMVAGGMTIKEAHSAYGIGPWSNEVDWCAVKKAIAVMGEDKAVRALSECAAAKRRVDAKAWCEGIFPESSHPRMIAWAKYALVIFFGGRGVPAEGKEIPESGNGWRLIKA